nr:DEAD/DEAH box helicase family protein [Nitrospira sp.]
KVRKARELYDLADAIDATKARKESPEDALPAGWTEASPGGMAASRDKTTGGIVDKNIATGKWFFVSNLGGVESKDGFDTRDEAFSALADASRMADKGKSANSEESPSAEKQQAAKDLNDALSDLADIFGKKFRANMMPEQEQKLFPVMVRVFDAAFRLGYHSFKDAARFVLQTIREKIGAEVADAVTIDHLQGAYIAMSGGKELATAKRDVVSVESKTELEQGNVPDERSGTDLERDSENAATENGVGKKGVRDGSGRDGGAGGPGVPGAETTGSSGSGVGIPGPEALADRAASDNEVYVGAPGVSPGASGDSVSQRGGDLRLDGPPIEPDAAKGIGAAATGRPDLARKIALQASAPTDPGASIADALPMLSAGQQEDVAKAERRFAVPDGYGMLFTNGTGTGKTFSGLGIIKRFSNAGKNNILIVVPNDKIIEDWQKSGRMLGLDISELKNTKDAGKGIVVTTYANMGANSELVRREWDLVVHDEAHHLMENSEARSTNALRTLRAITLHPDGANDRHAALYADEIMKLADLRARLKNNIEIGKSSSIPVAEKERIAAENARLSESLALAEKRNRETQKIVREDVESRQGAVRPRALFLSFTPFAYEPSIDWANGYLFDYNEGRPSDKTESRGYNQGSNSDQFFMQHFGYRMRTGKLTQPDAKVDRGLMQRQFNAFLKKKGSLSGRVLDVEADYDRRFLLVESAIGQRIDEALEWFEDQGKKTNDKDRKAALRDVRKVIADKFDYQSRRYLLEAIKAQEVIPHIREHMAMGRKVVVFHDYNQGGGFNPFDMNERERGAEFSESGDTDLINSVIREFKTEFKDLIGSDLFKASSPIANFQKQFPGVLLVNGLVPAKTRRENVARFQDDASGPQLILVQSQAGKEGISLHDTTGKHQRVLFNLGQPTQPTMAMQQEGRIYRMGQVTDAIIRYLNTGTNWERWAFATTIAQRASAAENLGSGELARALKDAFISGFEESGNYRAGMEDEGKGGKARDAAANNVLSEYDRAKAFYFGTQKKDSRTKAQEGTDYYATPEPIGLKMVEFADIRAGDDVLEPSAGHGAIARWIPEHAKRTAIEPSTALRSRLAMVFDGNILGSNFEDLNVVNKFDAIVMNPPFGTGGKTAVDHLAKAATHLRDGGRIVALLPTGPAADKRLDKWLNGGEEVAVKPLVTHPELGPIYKGDTISTQTDTGLVVERMLSADTIVAKSPTMRAETAHLVRNIVKADPTGPRTTESGPSKDVYQIADIQLPAVTFERAGTGVRTHIVVLEKQTNKNKLNTVPQKISRDYSDAENINTLFDRIENAFVRPRENAREEESAQTKAPSVGAQGSEKVRPDGGPATVEKMLPGGKLLTDAPKITYTTKAGKK